MSIELSIYKLKRRIRRAIIRFFEPELDDLIQAAVNVKVDKAIIAEIVRRRRETVSETGRHKHERN